MKFSGSIPALITPFTNDAVNFDTLAKLIEWHIAEGSSALVICGTTGECPTLSHQEQFETIATAVKIARGRIPIIAGAGSNCTREALDLTSLAKKAGADAALHATGYYNKPSQAQVIEHFRAVDAASELPIIVYNIPSRTGIEFSIETMAKLAEFKNIVGVKDSTGNVARLSQERIRINKEFSYLSGDDGTVLGYMAHGGAGCISVTANIVPRMYADFIAAGLKGDFETARSLQDKMIELHMSLFIEPSPGGAKYALSRMGLCENTLRAPITPITDAARERMDIALARVGISF